MFYLPCTPADGVRVAVRLTRARRAIVSICIARLAMEACCGSRFRPTRRRPANTRCSLAAKEWGVPRRDVTIVNGEKSAPTGEGRRIPQLATASGGPPAALQS